MFSQHRAAVGQALSEELQGKSSWSEREDRSQAEKREV